MPSIDKFIRKDEELDGFTFHCPASGCNSFVSRGWPEKSQAAERGIQHLTEHATGEDSGKETIMMEPLDSFNARHGLADIARGSEEWRELVRKGSE